MAALFPASTAGTELVETSGDVTEGLTTGTEASLTGSTTSTLENSTYSPSRAENKRPPTRARRNKLEAMTRRRRDMEIN
jgi:hypothetical protein